eukprot:CAMPEP_0185745002 /NCGR_PEP_ID=MMETSP1174-20130828/3290_1 /TAXON_ID=35687 /ORGANISM="Dictyocha speculum, Strain CCMP1381" /LENGTH=68 /DNA_ID=CAMNT_0028418769 /DNA_START=119 /DNA_END=322 /DNA_ORIENTATION=-
MPKEIPTSPNNQMNMTPFPSIARRRKLYFQCCRCAKDLVELLVEFLHFVRKPCGKYPLDGEIFLNKNK